MGLQDLDFDNAQNHHGLAKLIPALNGELVACDQENFSATLEHINVEAGQVPNEVGATSYRDNALPLGRKRTGPDAQFVIILNLGDESQQVSFPIAEKGLWSDLLSDYQGTWKEQINEERFRLTIGGNLGACVL